MLKLVLKVGLLEGWVGKILKRSLRILKRSLRILKRSLRILEKSSQKEFACVFLVEFVFRCVFDLSFCSLLISLFFIYFFSLFIFFFFFQHSFRITRYARFVYVIFYIIYNYNIRFTFLKESKTKN